MQRAGTAKVRGGSAHTHLPPTGSSGQVRGEAGMEQEGGTFALLRSGARLGPSRRHTAAPPPPEEPGAAPSRCRRRVASSFAPSGPSPPRGSPAAVPRYLRGRSARQPRPARPSAAAGSQEGAAGESSRRRGRAGKGRAGTPRAREGRGPGTPAGLQLRKGHEWLWATHWELPLATGEARRAVATCLPALLARGWLPALAWLLRAGNSLP